MQTRTPRADIEAGAGIAIAGEGNQSVAALIMATGYDNNAGGVVIAVA